MRKIVGKRCQDDIDSSDLFCQNGIFSYYSIRLMYKGEKTC